MVDNVRRGSELVGRQGGATAGFAFATLYRVRRWMNGTLANSFEGGQILSSGQDPAGLFG